MIGGVWERAWVGGTRRKPIENRAHVTFQVRGWELVLGSLVAWVWLGGLDGVLGGITAPLDKLKEIYAPGYVPGETPPAGLYYTPGGRVINPTSTQSPPAPGGGVYALPTQGSPFPRGPFAGGAFGWL